ncbi:MAG: hypothetical protein ACO1O4_09135 [Devosia sp.]
MTTVRAAWWALHLSMIASYAMTASDPIAAVQTASSIACKPPFNCYEIAIQHCDVTKVTIQLAKFVES